MKCPYCRNEIKDNSTECEVCGVDLSYQQRDRVNRKVVGIFFLIFGIVTLSMGIGFGFISNIVGSTFKNTNGNGITSVVALMPILIGVVISGIGLFNIFSSNKLQSGEERSTNIAKHVIGFVFVGMFNVVWIISLRFMYTSMQMFTMEKTNYLILGIFILVPIFTTISYIIAIIKGLRK